MKTTKITEKEMQPLRVASLPTRPTAPTAFGGRGYTATEMKEAFDKLPCLIIERFNMLLEDVEDRKSGLAASIPTGITEDHRLKDLFLDILTGALAEYMQVPGGALSEVLISLRGEIDELKATLGGA